MVDPFDLIGLAMGKHIRKEFWKEEHGKSKGGDEESGGKEDAEKAAGVGGDGSGIGKEKAIISEGRDCSSRQVSDESRVGK